MPDGYILPPRACKGLTGHSPDDERHSMTNAVTETREALPEWLTVRTHQGRRGWWVICRRCGYDRPHWNAPVDVVITQTQALSLARKHLNDNHGES